MACHRPAERPPHAWGGAPCKGESTTHVTKLFYVYILASGQNGTLYIGVTSNLLQRVWQHKEGFADGFTKRYNIKSLVWYEQHEEAVPAITREKQLKKWNRAWKIDLIEKKNPDWRDLYLELTA